MYLKLSRRFRQAIPLHSASDQSKGHKKTVFKKGGKNRAEKLEENSKLISPDSLSAPLQVVHSRRDFLPCISLPPSPPPPPARHNPPPHSLCTIRKKKYYANRVEFCKYTSCRDVCKKKKKKKKNPFVFCNTRKRRSLLE